MVYTGGNNIISAFTGGVPVKSIYTYGQLVWPSEPEPPVPTGYYIRWTPSNISGTFTMEGSTYNLDDYSGYFEFSGSRITKEAFDETSFVTVVTNAEEIQQWAFYGCSSLSKVSLPNCTYIEGTAFYDCTSLKNVSIPVCTYVGEATFKHCTALTTISLPECTYIDGGAFDYCRKLTTISLPECTGIMNNAFRSCMSLSSISLPKCSFIGSYAFLDTILNTIVLGVSTVCICTSQTFLRTPIESGSGSIYVPSSLVSDYKVADNWSEYASVIYPIPN